MKKLSVLLICIIIGQSIAAQVLQITGRVMSTTKQPIEFANVILKRSDSTFVTGGITDEKGRFRMENLKSGSYKLQVSSLGFQTKSLAILSESKNIDLGTIEMDSSEVVLKEVTVTASAVINQIDHKIVLPNATQIKSSTNGFNLLQKLNLSHIQVDVMRRTISASGGGEVQIRINGVKASIEEAFALRPENILRVEHYEDPGVRYQGAEAVINYVTRRNNSGGYVMVETSNSPHVIFGDNSLSTKINHNKSEFGFTYSGGYREIKNMWRENRETFTFADGRTLTRLEEGMPDTWAKNWHRMNLNYNYEEAGKWFFNASARLYLNNDPKTNFRSMLYPLDKPNQKVNMTDYSTAWEHAPSIDLYFQRTLKNNQALILNVVGTYIDSNSGRTYREMKDDKVLTDMFTNVDGNKYSLIGEGIYEKKSKLGKLSFGVKHTQSYSNNEYSGVSLTQTNMSQSETYVYGEFQGKLKKLNYSIGIGGNRSWFKQAGDGYQDYTFRPTLGMTYNFSNNTFIRYRGRIYTAAPSLSDLGNIEQNIDSLQIRRGNSNLKPSTNYVNSLTFDIRKGIFGANLNVAHFYQKNPIMEQIDIESNKFIRMKDNQQSWQKLASTLELSVRPFKDILTLKLITGINYFDSKGNNYHHKYTNWYYRAEANAYYKNWSVAFQIQNHRNDFYGETLNYGENYHIIQISRNLKQWTLGVMMLNPFMDVWKAGEENRSSQIKSQFWAHAKDSSRLLCISASYSFSFGRKHEASQKRLNNEDTDSGVMSSGRK